MMHGSERLRRWIVAALAWLVAFAVSGCGSSEEQPFPGETISEESDAVVCGTFQVDDGYGPTDTPEWYHLVALNSKLKHFPEFAAFFGSNRVTDCEGARSFIKAQSEYRRLHPAFDENEVREFPDDRVPPPSDRTLPSVPKILGGTKGPFLPVVQVRSPSGRPCSGTVIAKNWIVTAAHCLYPGPDPTKIKVHKWYKYRVDWADPNGDLGGFFAEGLNVLQYADPAYQGDFPGTEEPVFFDAGLLQILDDQDGFLPINGSPMPPGLGPYMRISLRGFSTQGASFWGYGHFPNFNALESLQLAPYNPVSQQPGGRLLAHVPATNPDGTPFTGPYFCRGDSGGPIVDTYLVPSGNNSFTREPVVVGILSAVQVGTDPNHRCAIGTGEEVWWVRMDTEMDFFNAHINELYLGFQCKNRAQFQENLNTFSECFGAPCQEDHPDCSASERCQGSPKTTDVFICKTCDPNNPSLGCDCFFGQCLPDIGPR